VIWLLAAEEVGTGGEKGNGGYCIEVRRLILDTTGEIVGAASPSASAPKRALSFASLSSSTYASHSALIQSISIVNYIARYECNIWQMDGKVWNVDQVDSVDERFRSNI
jgi:hypothetical protein